LKNTWKKGPTPAEKAQRQQKCSAAEMAPRQRKGQRSRNSRGLGEALPPVHDITRDQSSRHEFCLPELQDLLQDIRNSSLCDLESLAAECLPSEALPNNYLNLLDAVHKTVALRACLIVHIVSKYSIIPCQY
jgi:hypothetical protein